VSPNPPPPKLLIIWYLPTSVFPNIFIQLSVSSEQLSVINYQLLDYSLFSNSQLLTPNSFNPKSKIQNPKSKIQNPKFPYDSYWR
ncbi:MAG: hypothetical protein WBA39_15555, partial [Rivularia sp. (in: cyanobacteria)]